MNTCAHWKAVGMRKAGYCRILQDTCSFGVCRICDKNTAPGKWPPSKELTVKSTRSTLRSMKTLDAKLVESTLSDPEFTEEFPEFKDVKDQLTATATKKKAIGGCSSCAKRAARRKVVAAFTQVLTALPRPRRAALHAYFGEDIYLEGYNPHTRRVSRTIL